MVGQGRFVDDLSPSGAVFAVFVRAQQTGRVARLLLEPARGMAGVVAVFGAADLPVKGQAAVNPLLPMGTPPSFAPLAQGFAVAGQGVAMVLATSALAAEDAALAIEVEIEAADFPASGFSGAHEVGARPPLPEGALIVSATVTHSQLAPMALEPRATLAVPEADGVTAYVSCQTPYRVRDDLCTLLGWPAERVRVIAPDVGGAFGGKASITPEDASIVLAAVAVGRPVKWRASRSEEFLAAPRGRGGQLQGKLTLGPDGTLLALEAEGAFPAGAWWPYSVAAPARNFSRILPGPYRVEHTRCRVDVTSLPAAAVNIYRGAGRPEATMLMERLIDQAAAAKGIDPLAFRLAHVLRKGDMAVGPDGPGGFDAADLPRLLKSAAKAIRYPGLRKIQARRRAKGEVVGIGIASYIEPCGQGFEWARVGLTATGQIVAFTGASAQGQGRETAMAQIVADVLGVSPGSIVVRHGDTGVGGNGIGALASRSTAIGGSAMLLAARAFKRKLRGDAAQDVAERLAAKADAQGLVLAAEKTFTAPGEAWASGAVIAAVSLCKDTGRLTIEKLVWADDAGVVVNPVLVEGQLHGGLAQGLGEAMMERLVSDSDGQLLTGSLMDYAVPRAADVPQVVLVKAATRSVMNPLGAKGVGEAGCIGIPAALVNAACDALGPYGITHLDMPLTSETLWRAMNRKNP